MKLTTYVVRVVIGTLIALAGIWVIAFPTTDVQRSLVAVMASVALVAFLGPLVLGAFSTDGRTSGRVRALPVGRGWLLAVIGVQVMSVIAIIVMVLSSDLPWLSATSLIVSSVLLVLSSHVAVNTVQRLREKRSLPFQREQSFAAGLIERTIRNAVMAFVITAAVATLAVAIICLTSSGDQGLVWLWPGVIGIAMVMAGIACNRNFSTVSPILRATAGGDSARLLKFSQIVLRRRSATLTPEEAEGITRYAATAALALRLQLAWYVLFFGGWALIQAVNLLTTSTPTVLLYIVAAGAILIVAIAVPVLVIRIRRANRFADANQVTAGGLT